VTKKTLSQEAIQEFIDTHLPYTVRVVNAVSEKTWTPQEGKQELKKKALEVS